VISLVTAPGDGEVTVVTDETMAEKDPLLAKLLAAAAAGSQPAGPASKRQPIRIVLDPDDRPVTKGALCGQTQGFNLQAATRVAANDKDARERLCRSILRPPLANDRLSILDDGNVRLHFKRPWSNGTSSVDLAPLALIARLAALVVPAGPRAHPPCPCPTRLRRARRHLHGAIPSFTAVYFPRTPLPATRWFPQLPSLRRLPLAWTSPRAAPCTCQRMRPSFTLPVRRRVALAAVRTGSTDRGDFGGDAMG
jgi:hypothetical protein